MATDGRGSNDVCPHRQGDGTRLGWNFKQRFPGWLLLVVVTALLAANTINIGADLAGMADAAEMLSGINSHLLVSAIRTPDFVGNDPTPLSRDSERAQVAGAGALRLSRYRFCGWSGLGRSGARDLDTFHATHQRRMVDAGGDSRHHDQSVFVFLAGE